MILLRNPSHPIRRMLLMEILNYMLRITIELWKKLRNIFVFVKIVSLTLVVGSSPHPNCLSSDKIIDRKVTKFVEALWRFLFFTVFTVVGYVVLISPERAAWTTGNTLTLYVGFIE